MASKKVSTVAAGAAIISAGTLVSRLIGLVRDNLLVNTFKERWVTDAYISAFGVPDLLYYLLAGGAMSAAFIPVFTSYLSKNQDEEAHQTGSTIATLLLLVMTIGAILEIIFAPVIVHLVAPGYANNPEQFRLTVTLTRIMCVMLIFTAQSGHLTGILNSYKHFLAPVVVWNVYNLAILLGVTVFSKLPFLGGSREHPNIMGVAYGVVLGAFLMAAIQFPVAIKHGFRFRLILDFAHEGVRRVMKLFFPVMIGLALGQVNLQLIPIIIGTLFEHGAVTDIRSANRLMLVPLGLFASAIATASFPRLTQMITLGENEEFRTTLARSFKAIMIFCIPSAMALFILAEPVAGLLYGGRGFGLRDIQATGFVLAIFSWGLLALGAQQLISRAFYAMHDTLTPVLCGVGMVAVNIPLSWLLARYTPLQYGGTAFATTLTTTVSTFVLFNILRKRMRGIGGREILSTTTKIALASLVMGVVMFALARIFSPVAIDGNLRDILLPAAIVRWPAPFLTGISSGMHPLPGQPGLRFQLLLCIGISGFAGFAAYLGALKVLGVGELSLITNRIVGRFRRRPAAV